jgi:hypothetical protein
MPDKKLEEFQKLVAHQEELHKASERIGPTPEDGVRWLLRFSEDDLTRLSAGDVLNRRYECFAFALGRQRDLPNLYFEEGEQPFPSADDLATFHENVREVVKAVLSHGRVKFQFSDITLNLHHEAFAADSPWLLRATSDSNLDVFRFAVLYEVLPLARKIRRCPECQKIFLADRTNQEFCSVQCQNRGATRRYRKTLAASSGTITVSGTEAKLQKQEPTRPLKPTKGGKR